MLRTVRQGSADTGLVERAKELWANSDQRPDTCSKEAETLCDELRKTSNHAAFGWVALTCGKQKVFANELDSAEGLLSEALGRLLFVGDRQGADIASALLGVALSFRDTASDRDIALASRSLKHLDEYLPRDQALIHSLIACCYWRKDQPHEALVHLLKEHDLGMQLQSMAIVAKVLSNLALILEHLGEFELAVEAVDRASNILPSGIANKRAVMSMLITKCHLHSLLGNARETRDSVDKLREELSGSRVPAHWIGYINVSEGLSFQGKSADAAKYLAIGKELCPAPEAPRSRAIIEVTEAELRASSGNFIEAMALLRWICDAPLKIVGRTPAYIARKRMSEYALQAGKKQESLRWARKALEVRRSGFLGNMMSQRIRASIRSTISIPDLTQQELACLSLCAHGQTSADIGIKLGITTRTVNFHFSKILKKLNAMNRQEALAKAITAQLIQAPFH